MGQDDDLAWLELLMPPPEPPIDVPGRGDWQAAESAIGRQLPPDFKAFVSRYGAGQVDGFIHILNPTASREPVRLAPTVARITSGLRTLRESSADEVPHALHPEPGGLIPWAVSDNGDIFCWDTGASDSAEWSIVLGESGGPRWATHPGPMTRFLAELLDGSYRPPFLPATWPDDVHSYQAYAANPHLERLNRLLPPPENVVTIDGALERAELEARIGSRLPGDYWVIVNLYGRGSFGGELVVLEPAVYGPRALIAGHQASADLFGLLADHRPGEVPFLLHPEEGGLLTWGRTASGVMCFWRTVGEPDAWPIVVRDAMRSEWFTHRGPIAWFLSDLADGSIDVTFLAGGVSRLQFRPGAADGQT